MANTLTAAGWVVDPIASPRGDNGYRTVLFGDSMVDTTDTVVSGVTATYDASTGVLTVSSAAHQLAAGWFLTIWNRALSYPATNGLFRTRVASVIDANTFTVNIGANRAVSASDANWRYRPESWRSSQGFFTWLQAFSGQRFNVVRNAAASGDTTADCVARFANDVAAYQPQVVIMQMPGINDTSVGNGNIKEDTIAANQQRLVDLVLSLGALLVLLTVTPPAASEGRTTLTNMMRVVRLNQRLKDYCAGKAGVILFDAFRRIVDPASAVGAALTNYIRTTDNIHYSQRGSRFIGEELWNAISPQFPSDLSSLPVSMIDNFWAAATALTSVTRAGGLVTATISGGSPGYQVGERLKLVGGSESWNEYVTLTAAGASSVSFVTAAGADGSITGTIRLSRSRNLVPNHLFTTATGGSGVAGTGTSSGTFAGNVRVENVAGSPGHVASVVARADGYGNNQRVVITAAASNDHVAISSDFTTYATDVPAMVLAGRQYFAECMLSLTGVSGSNLREIRFNMELTVGGTVYQAYAMNGFAEGALINTDVANLHLRTATVALPAGAVGQIKWRASFLFSALGTALTVEIGRVRFQEVEA